MAFHPPWPRKERPCQPHAPNGKAPPNRFQRQNRQIPGQTTSVWSTSSFAFSSIQRLLHCSALLSRTIRPDYAFTITEIPPAPLNSAPQDTIPSAEPLSASLPPAGGTTIQHQQVMPQAEGSQTQTQSQGSSRGRSNHVRRGGRGGKGQRSNNGRSVGGADAPGETSSSQTPSTAAQQNAKPNPPSDGKSRGGRNRRNNRGRGGGAAAGAGATATAGPGRRAFGGHLTTSADQEQGEPTAALSLSADAPEFVPGKPVVSRR